MTDRWNRAVNEVLLNAHSHQDWIEGHCYRVKIDWNETNRVAQALLRGENVETSVAVLQYIMWTHENTLVVMSVRELLRTKFGGDMSSAVKEAEWHAQDEAYVPPKRYEYVISGFGQFVDAR